VAAGGVLAVVAVAEGEEWSSAASEGWDSIPPDLRGVDVLAVEVAVCGAGVEGAVLAAAAAVLLA